MIVPMKRLILLCVAEDSANTLEKLRDLDKYGDIRETLAALVF